MSPEPKESGNPNRAITVERLATVIAILGSMFAAEGVLYNVFYLYFPSFSMNAVSMLTMGDHLSTAAAHLPLLILGGGIGYALGRKYPLRPPSATAQRFFGRWVYIALALGALGSFLGGEPSLGALLAMLFVVRWLANNGRRQFELLLGGGAVLEREVVLGVAVTTTFLCFKAFTLGLIAYDIPSPSVRVSTDAGVAFEGDLLGIYDRGMLVIGKPDNRLHFLSPRASLHVEQLKAAPDGHWLRQIIQNWLKPKTGISD